MSALNVFTSFQEAVELAKEPNSGCILENTKRHIALSPKYIGRVRSGVGEILDAELGRFSKCLCGVLLAYGNIKLLQSSGSILDDSPFIHFDIKFDAVVFKPNIGSLLKCVVNEQASDHVGCLVHNWFNVSLLASRRGLNGKRQLRLEPGHKVLVQVERLHEKNGMLAIEARAPDDGSSLILENVACQNETDSESNLDSSQQPPISDTPDAPGPSALTPGEETKKSGKKKKRKHSNVKEEGTVDSNQPLVCLVEASDCEKATSQKMSKKKSHTENASEYGDSFSSGGAAGEETSPRKKKKKQKNTEVEFTELSLEPVAQETVPGMTGKETSSKKKKKKKEREERTNLDSSQPSIEVEQHDTNAPERQSDNQALLDEPSSDETFTKLKKKKRKDRENSSKQWLVADIKSSTEDRTLPVKVKKEKRKHADEITEVKRKHSGSGSKSGNNGTSEHTLGCETVTESHKKHKRKVKDHNVVEDSLVNGSRKKTR